MCCVGVEGRIKTFNFLPILSSVLKEQQGPIGHIENAITKPKLYDNPPYLMAWFCYRFLNLCCQHDAKLIRELQHELKNYCGSVRHIESWNTIPTTISALLETFRYTTPRPMGLSHVCTQPNVVGRFWVEKGWQVVINYWTVMHDEHLWVEPRQFIPKRFLTNTEKGPRLLTAEHQSMKTVKILFDNHFNDFLDISNSMLFNNVLSVVIHIVKNYDVNLHMREVDETTCEDYLNYGILQKTDMFHLVKKL